MGYENCCDGSTWATPRPATLNEDLEDEVADECSHRGRVVPFPVVLMLGLSIERVYYTCGNGFGEPIANAVCRCNCNEDCKGFED